MKKDWDNFANRIITMDRKMKPELIFRRATTDDAFGISSLVRDAFLTNVAPYNNEKGSLFFVRVQNPSYFQKKISEWPSVFVAEKDRTIIGVIAMSDRISSFWVLHDYQKQGIGKKLFSIAICDWVKKTGKQSITVNSSPNAVEIYSKLGFYQYGEEKLENDIRSFTMRAEIKDIFSKLSLV